VTVTESVVSVAVYVTVSATESLTVKVATPLAFVVPETVVIVDDPAPAARVTVLPGTGLPFASFSVAVSVEVALPSATTLSGLALFASKLPFSVAVIVALPVVVGDVSVAVYVPSALSDVAPTEPAFVDTTTVPPLPARLWPSASFSRTVIVLVVDPFATIEPG